MAVGIESCKGARSPLVAAMKPLVDCGKSICVNAAYRGGVWDLVGLLELPERYVHDVVLEQRNLPPVAEKVYVHDLLQVNVKSVLSILGKLRQFSFLRRMDRLRIFSAGLLFEHEEDHNAKLSWNW